MATSGTIAQTVLDTATVLEHAVRRCGIQSSLQTPEMVNIAKQNLYLLLLNLANRGINLWCVEKNILGLREGSSIYDLPVGTIRTLNVVYAQATRHTSTDTVTATQFKSDLGDQVKTYRYGLKFATTVTAALTLERSTDDSQWDNLFSFASQEWVADTWYWFEFDSVLPYQYVRVNSATPFTLDEFYLASSVSEVPMSQFNRDEYAQLTNKSVLGRPSTNYLFDKTLNPTLSIWPVPNNSYDQLTVWRHRFVQDVGTLTQQIEVPQQWVEAIIWQLAARLAFEIPDIQPERRQEVLQASDKFMTEAELGESDNAPIYWVPGIGVYTA